MMNRIHQLVREGAMALLAIPACLHAQFSFSVDGRPVQVHSFASQGFAYSNDNSYLTMNTTQGSFNFTDGGVNVSSHLNEKLRAGAQAYCRRLGELNRGQVTLDWAYIDYRPVGWFGFRGGRVKTVLGLYNDLQDVDSLFTWALLPQSMYPIDLRGSTIAHIGGDFYGKIPLRRLGEVEYTAYDGMLPNDPHQGYLYALRGGFHWETPYVGPIGGGDLRWNTPVNGMLAGASYMTQHPSGSGEAAMGGGPGSGSVPGSGSNAFTQESVKRQIAQFYLQLQVKKFQFDGEYRRDYRDQAIYQPGDQTMYIQWNQRSWYIAGAYRLNRRLEIGSYWSRFINNWTQDWSQPGNHIYDKVVTGRVDLSRFWTVKVEGHFIDGYGNMDSTRGFYGFGGPGGENSLQPQTNVLIVRTGFSF
ncbi:MAG: hypothetical protein ACLQG3_06260 [Terracidiphilus sp.]